LKILLATPAYGSVVTTAYHDSVVKLLSYFQAEFPGILFETSTLSLSLISLARNLFASQMLADESFTHLLFIDADMGFRPNLIAKMLSLQKPITGIIAPQRRLDYEAYHQARLKADNPLIAKVIANDYVSVEGIIRDPSGELEVVDGFIRMEHMGTGIMLIERKVLEAIRERFTHLWVAEPPESVRRLGLPSGGLLQCFEPGRDQHGIALGEDVSFCLRWSQELKGEIWANVDEAIMHVGQDNYSGHYLTKLDQTGVKLNIVGNAD
jgi:hypothetical protein